MATVHNKNITNSKKKTQHIIVSYQTGTLPTAVSGVWKALPSAVYGSPQHAGACTVAGAPLASADTREATGKVETLGRPDAVVDPGATLVNICRKQQQPQDSMLCNVTSKQSMIAIESVLFSLPN